VDKTFVSCSGTASIRIDPVNARKLLAARRVEILAIATRHGAENLRVFGSVARGESDAESDIDFLVRLAPGRSLFDLGGLLSDLEALLGCHVDVVTETGLRPRIRERVLGEAVPL
jgi:predicted nucleotidyltransferase